MFRRLRAPKPETTGSGPAEGDVQSCPGLARVLQRLLRDENAKPRVLDLGPMCGSTVTYLADRGARVSVEEFHPPPRDNGPPDDDEWEPPPLRIVQPDASFDLVLVWEHLDFVPPERLDEFGQELARVTASGGFVLLFSRDHGTRGQVAGDRLGSYRLIADDKMIFQPGRGSESPRWSYPARDVENALSPLSIQGIQLKSGRMREIVAGKR